MYACMTAAGQAGFEWLACCPEAGVVLAAATAVALLGALRVRQAASLEFSLGCLLSLLWVAVELLLET